MPAWLVEFTTCSLNCCCNLRSPSFDSFLPPPQYPSPSSYRLSFPNDFENTSIDPELKQSYLFDLCCLLWLCLCNDSFRSLSSLTWLDLDFLWHKHLMPWITGGNIENASYTVGICAERVAASKAVSEGKKDFKAIAISSRISRDFIGPCGSCRQFLVEFAPNLVLFLTKPDGSYQEVTLKQLLPMTFTAEQLFSANTCSSSCQQQSNKEWDGIPGTYSVCSTLYFHWIREKLRGWGVVFLSVSHEGKEIFSSGPLELISSRNGMPFFSAPLLTLSLWSVCYSFNCMPSSLHSFIQTFICFSSLLVVHFCVDVSISFPSLLKWKWMLMQTLERHGRWKARESCTLVLQTLCCIPSSCQRLIQSLCYI